MAQEDIITGEITGMAFGGSGILRHHGQVVFIPFTAPGDHVVARIKEGKKNYAFGELLELLHPAPQRVNPACPYFGKCGGCQLQHLSYPAQLEHKRQMVEDALKRIGGLEFSPIPPLIPATMEWSYRRHITLTLRPNEKGSFTAGYFAVDSKTHLAIKECPIFIQSTDPIIEQVQELAGKFKAGSKDDGKVVILKHPIENNYILSFHFQSLPKNTPGIIEEYLSKDKRWNGATVHSPRFFKAFGKTSFQWKVEQLTLSFSPGAFLQNNSEQSLNIYRDICKIAEESNAVPILDLYCGIGITTLMMAAAGKKVLGVESNSEAIRLANENARLNQVDHVEFITADVKNALKILLQKHSPQLVIINPPRIGIEKEVLQTLLENHPAEIVYISCMPSTLARDLKLFCQEIYQLTHCQAYDMFPQTGHIETLVHLQRKK